MRIVGLDGLAHRLEEVGGPLHAAVCAAHPLAEHTNSSYRNSATRLPPYSPCGASQLARVTELKLAGDPFDWLPDRWDPPEVEPSVELWAGDRSVVLPLPWAGRTKRQRPDITAVLDRLHNRWAIGA